MFVIKMFFIVLHPQTMIFWFWAMAKSNNTNIRLIDEYIKNIVCVDGTQSDGLWESENSKGEGSRQFKNILQRYPE